MPAFWQRMLRGGKAPSPFQNGILDLPEGQRVYAVGDIHGRADLLKMLLEQLRADAFDYAGKITLVTLGDHIDRGPDSRGVVELLLQDVPMDWDKIHLRGNHEQALIDFLADPEGNPDWLGWGAEPMLSSYGVQKWGSKGFKTPAALAEDLHEALIGAGQHQDFFEDLPMTWQCGKVLFVHAGVRPGIPLKHQLAHDLLFIRDDFLDVAHGMPYRIIFGHTILPAPLVLDDRIGLDTGAFQTGVLSAAALEGNNVRILQTR